MNASVEGRTDRADRVLALSVGFAALLAGTMPALSADLEDPLSPLTSAKGSMLCFRRDYSSEHLAQHPTQTTKSVLLAFREQGFDVTIVLTPRTGAPKRIAAGCAWSQRAGIDTSDRQMIPDFHKVAGFDCMATLGGGSAVEGGYLLIDPARDAKSLTLFLQSPIYAFDEKPGKARGFMKLGPEDLTFMLTRIEPKACAPFKAATD
jgi:hypothetical protein